jgi:uncharacterized protein YndB with AHSA1/START domain
MMAKSEGSTFVYVTYIRTTPQKLWTALTDGELMREYWLGAHCECDWKAGSPWRLVLEDGTVADAGEILEADAPRRLAIKWRNMFRPELSEEGYSVCTMELEPQAESVRLTVTHTSEQAESKLIHAVSGGWPLILSNLKSLLETGGVAVQRKKAAA